MPCYNNLGKMALSMLTDGLKSLQSRDLFVVYYCEEDGTYTKSLCDLLDNRTDFYDDWLCWLDPLMSWKPNIQEGKTRTVKGSIVILCDWDPHELIKKYILKLHKPLPGEGSGNVWFE